MSQLGKFAVPLAVAGVVLAVAGVTVGRGAAPKYPVHTLTTSEGTKVLQTFDGKSFHALVPGPRGNVALNDGRHKLANGGEIEVRGGRIVWDAFGVVEKFNKTGLAGLIDPVG